MFKIDIHTHIIPENINEISGIFSDRRFLNMERLDSKHAMLNKDKQPFRKVSCNCWDASQRIKDCTKNGVNVQVLSTIPVLFSYWADANDGVKLSQFLNDHIYNIIKENPRSEESCPLFERCEEDVKRIHWLNNILDQELPDVSTYESAIKTIKIQSPCS